MAGPAELRSIVGDDHLRVATDADSVDGIRPRVVVSPGTIEEVGAVMALASRSGWRVTPRGGGSKLGLGNPPGGVDLVVDLSRFDRLIEHATGDLVLSVEAGVRIQPLQQTLATAGQMLALDVRQPDATAGGVIATNTSGPRRLAYGTVRDLLIGVTIVLSDGTVAKAGGKVVKNVAGYDLSKLMAGSLGTLGIIVKANFRLHPSPRAARVVEADLAGGEAISPAVQRLLHSPIVPSAIQLRWRADGGPRIGVLLEGSEPSVVAQADTTSGLIGNGNATVSGSPDETRDRWGAFTAAPGAGDVVIRITTQPAQLSETVAAVQRAARRAESIHIDGSLGSGILEVHLSGSDPKTVAEILGEIRSGLRRGSAVLVSAPLEVKRMVDVWGPVGGALDLMRRVKERFDPTNTLNPGRFVGGI